ncbi:MAG: hypothetical protein A2900_05470 [Candidatus Chisholmbacteria bacterium RIFCSPLOWO2_01_FULL_50_28]|uniref:Uncharacterized protein n=1 Tax=Candidatus Chisholmbacteria bacterium RIFCSPHIGHO2_01_FULL_52_32 TaxID=1797591 RepID=A0A1G1VRV2_9BACT|nr:MAG: hypothetical protein A2786_01275 [Candidatus Chisholmbacteria bacterium RIFCSPHIGHO2_01_FULL_52_32]OGY20494.1 MAG: hypothetical protein A2900_05470 [Candidatus Chisholmbacteria bacterium RIFCSPLOWO2_01_FULL_50_28]
MTQKRYYMPDYRKSFHTGTLGRVNSHTRRYTDLVQHKRHLMPHMSQLDNRVRSHSQRQSYKQHQGSLSISHIPRKYGPDNVMQWKDKRNRPIVQLFLSTNKRASNLHTPDGRQ